MSSGTPIWVLGIIRLDQDRWADSYITGESNHYWTFGRGPQGKSRVLKFVEARAMVANKLRNGIMQKEMPEPEFAHTKT
jgi:hypothetical protein